MANDADRVVSDILRADDCFLGEVGRLTLLFNDIEDRLAHDVLDLLQVMGRGDVEGNSLLEVQQLRMLEKRDFLKQVCADISHFYSVDHNRVVKILDELGSINRLRRAVVHGWIRWSAADEKPVFVDSHGQSISAWPNDLAGLNLKVLSWIREYYSEQAALLRAVLHAYETFADRLLGYPKLSPEIQALLGQLKAKAADGAI